MEVILIVLAIVFMSSSYKFSKRSVSICIPPTPRSRVRPKSSTTTVNFGLDWIGRFALGLIHLYNHDFNPQMVRLIIALHERSLVKQNRPVKAE